MKQILQNGNYQKKSPENKGHGGNETEEHHWVEPSCYSDNRKQRTKSLPPGGRLCLSSSLPIVDGDKCHLSIDQHLRSYLLVDFESMSMEYQLPHPLRPHQIHPTCHVRDVGPH